MKYLEIHRDVFTMDEKYFLAHCISSDAKMGAGVAVRFNREFKLSHLRNLTLLVGGCVKSGRVLNLITKLNYWDKPTRFEFNNSLKSMKKCALEHDIKYIAMPQIGSGLDRLPWSETREAIERIFADTDIEIVVCFY